VGGGAVAERAGGGGDGQDVAQADEVGGAAGGEAGERVGQSRLGVRPGAVEGGDQPAAGVGGARGGEGSVERVECGRAGGGRGGARGRDEAFRDRVVDDDAVQAVEGEGRRGGVARRSRRQ